MNGVVLLDGVRAALDRVRWWIMRVAPSRKRRREAAEKSGRTDSGWRGCEAEAEARRVEKGQRRPGRLPTRPRDSCSGTYSSKVGTDNGMRLRYGTVCERRLQEGGMHQNS